MRYTLISAVAAAAALSGCVATVPGVQQPVTPPVVVTPAPNTPVVVTPLPNNVPDTITARTVVSAEMAKRLPGRNVGALTECVMSNASQAELADLVAQQGKAAAGNAVAAIVQRPATMSCIKTASVA